MAAIEREDRLLSAIRRQTDRHRRAHGSACEAFPSGPEALRIVQVLAGKARGGHALEVGCGLGMTAIAIARSMRADRVETVEGDPVHAALARRNFARAGVTRRVRILEGPADAILARLRGPYDFVLEDADYGRTPSYYEDLVRLVRRGGLLVWENWFPLSMAIPDLAEAIVRGTRAWARRVSRDRRLATVVIGGVGISVRR